MSRAAATYVIRLDDSWLFGGTWRAEELDGLSVCPLVGFDPTITIGLGASGEVDDRHVALELAIGPEATGVEPGAVAEPEEEGAEEEQAGRARRRRRPLQLVGGAAESHRSERRIWVHPDAQLVAHDGYIVFA